MRKLALFVAAGAVLVPLFVVAVMAPVLAVSYVSFWLTGSAPASLVISLCVVGGVCGALMWTDFRGPK